MVITKKGVIYRQSDNKNKTKNYIQSAQKLKGHISVCATVIINVGSFCISNGIIIIQEQGPKRALNCAYKRIIKQLHLNQYQYNTQTKT